MKKNVYRTKEHRLIAAIKEWTGETLIGDDCAILPGRELITADTLVEGTHFLIPDMGFEDLGWKSMAVNLSDIAAMAGRPRYAVVSLTLPDRVGQADVALLYRGLIDCARAYRCRIVGGDLTRGQQLVIGITAIGDLHENGVMTRSGAQEGDLVIVSGDFGASAAGLWVMQQDDRRFPELKKRHCRPLPRLCESWSLVRICAGRGALMDASDGLADALLQISLASDTGMEIEEQLIPIAKETRQAAAAAAVDPLSWALYGGEDYELVGTVSAEHWQALQAMPDCAFTSIGSVTKGSEVQLRRTDRSLEPLTLERTFQHW